MTGAAAIRNHRGKSIAQANVEGDSVVDVLGKMQGALLRTFNEADARDVIDWQHIVIEIERKLL